MKTIKLISIGLVSLLLLTIYSCSKEGKYALQDPPPLDFHVKINGLAISFINNAKGATEVSWDFGDKNGTLTGDSVVHKYSTIGNYLISMSAKVNGQSFTYHKVLRVDKASLINLKDDSFDDWNSVTYPDFQLGGTADVLGAKVDYDANNVYVYIEFNAVAGADLESHIFGIYMDTDNSPTTGYSMKGMGVDYAIEGNIYANTIWPSKVDLVKGDPGWPFVSYNPEIPILPGTIKEANGVIKMEFGIPRQIYHINNDTFQFYCSVMNSDWSDIGNLVTADHSDVIVVKMNKQ